MRFAEQFPIGNTEIATSCWSDWSCVVCQDMTLKWTLSERNKPQLMKKLYQKTILTYINQQNQDYISYEVKILLYQSFELINIWRFPFLWWLFQQKYQENMVGQGKDSSHLDSTISLLVHTSKLVNLFNDKLVIRSNADPRLGQLNRFHKFMNDWRGEVKAQKTTTNLFLPNYGLTCNLCAWVLVQWLQWNKHNFHNP